MSDLDEKQTDSEEPKKASGDILRDEIREGRAAIERPVWGLFISGLSAGLDIGFSLFLIAITKTRFEGVLHPSVVELLTALMASVGFIFVVLGRSELFTEQTTLAVLPVLNRKASIGALARTWGVVYLANMIGAATFAVLAVEIGESQGVIAPRAFGEIAKALVGHPGHVIFLTGLLAGWLMGLLSWLVAASRDTISQIVLTMLVGSVIGYAHLSHVVLGTAEVLGGVFAGQGVTMADFLHFTVWTTLGNALGGPIFVAVIKYGHAIQGGSTPEAEEEEKR